MEQVRGGRILIQLHLKDQTVYYPKSNEMSSPCPKRTGNSCFELVRKLLGSLWHYFNMFKWFERDYTYHAEIAKELKQRNDEIYSAGMVSVVLVSMTSLISLAGCTYNYCDVKVL